MRTIVLTAVALAALAGCAKYEEPISLPPYGAAVRQNMQAQIVNPLPPEPKVAFTNGARQQLVIERYRGDKVEKPVTPTTQTVVAAPASGQQ